MLHLFLQFQNNSLVIGLKTTPMTGLPFTANLRLIENSGFFGQIHVFHQLDLKSILSLVSLSILSVTSSERMPSFGKLD